jgi:hypothetical protein
MTVRIQLKKEISGRDSQGAWCKDELTGDKPPVVKYLWLWLYKRILGRQLEEYELVVIQSPASKDVNTKAEEATALEAVTKRQPVKIQQTEKTLYVL